MGKGGEKNAQDEGKPKEVLIEGRLYDVSNFMKAEQLSSLWCCDA